MKATKALVAATAGIFLLSACSEDVQWSDPEITEDNDIVEADDTADEAAGTTEDTTSGADNGLSVAGGSAEESSGGFFDDLSAELEDWWNEDTTGSEDLTQPDNLGTDDSWEPYDRDEHFAHWKDTDGNGCDAREDTLARDLTNVVIDSDGCTVVGGTYDDPFSGRVIELERGAGADQYENGVDVDHIIPLAYVWENGEAWNWTEEKRTEIANDPENLVGMDPATNRNTKNDKGPSEWMPDDAEAQCYYATQWETVADKYEIEIPAEDVAVLAEAC